MGRRWVSVVALCALTLGCFSWRESQGGGEESESSRAIEAGDVALLEGYAIETVATGLTFPTGITFDEGGRPYLSESGYAYGEMFTRPRLLALGSGAPREVAAGGDREGPWNGLTFHDGAFFVADGGTLTGGRILRVDRDGKITPLISDLPSRGDHHTNGPVAHEGWLYFGQGSATNAGVVGPDNASFGWLRRFPEFSDIPCPEIVDRGRGTL
jgi:hypothetical protein